MNLKERNKLIIQYMPFVISIASSLWNKVPLHTEYDDIVSAGNLGLIKAIEQWDKTRNVKLITFAYYNIIGAMYEEIRKNDHIGRWTRNWIKKVCKAQTDLYDELQRNPTEEEIANRLNLTLKEYRQEQVHMIKAHNSISLGKDRDITNDSLSSNTEDYVRTKETDFCMTTIPNPLECIQKSELETALKKALKNLTDRERKVIELYFYEGYTLQEIGEKLSLSSVSIFNCKKRGLEKIKKNLKNVYNDNIKATMFI